MPVFSRLTASQKENIQNDSGCDFNTNSIYPILHNHAFFEFTFFFARTKHYINGKTVWLEPNTLIFVRPEDTHYLSDCQETLGHLNLKLSCDNLRSVCDYIDKGFYELLMQADDMQLSLQTSPEFSHQVRSFLDKLLTTSNLHAKYIASKFLICDYLQLFYQHLCEVSETHLPSIVQDAMLLLRNFENFSTNTTDLLSGLGYSYMHIYRLFKESTGQTPNAFFLEQKLLYAANLLSYTRYKIVDIASLCGFSTQSRFDTAFKEFYGISPREYRKTHAIKSGRNTTHPDSILYVCFLPFSGMPPQQIDRCLKRFIHDHGCPKAYQSPMKLCCKDIGQQHIAAPCTHRCRNQRGFHFAIGVESIFRNMVDRPYHFYRYIHHHNHAGCLDNLRVLCKHGHKRYTKRKHRQ